MTYYSVVTSINKPTEAVKRLAKAPDCRLIVAGDRKTPEDWQCEGTLYLGIEKQKGKESGINARLPFDHYCRKMTGYLAAMSRGATMILDTDDDNIPERPWDFRALEAENSAARLCTKPDLGWKNVYGYFGKHDVWPRGFPLTKILDPDSRIGAVDTLRDEATVGIWQGLSDGEADVDAIYRLTRGGQCFFDRKEPIIFLPGTVCPLNSQNTVFRKELFSLLYLPAYVNFRFTDILRGLIAQPIMWMAGYHVAFCNPNVVQERNEHDFFKDFLDELPCYQYAENVYEIAVDAVSSRRSIEDNLVLVYDALQQVEIVESDEIRLLEAWLADVGKLSD